MSGHHCNGEQFNPEEYKKTGNISITELKSVNACEDSTETNLKLFEKKRGGTEGMSLCLRLGGSPTSPWSSYDEVILQGMKQDCPILWVPISYDNTSNERKGEADDDSTTNIIWSKNYPVKSESRQCAYLNTDCHN